MKNWPIKSLGELCDVRIGRTPRRDEPRFWGGNAAWITVSELNGDIITKSKEQISDIAIRECMPEPVPAGTLLFSFKLSIGKMAIAGCPLYTNEAIAALPIRNPAELSRNFLRFALLRESHEGKANTAVMGKVLNKEKVQQILIHVPPLVEQERIVKLLDEADELRKLRAQADRRTADLIPALFHEMFGDPIHVSKDWQMVKLGELCTIRRGASPRPIDKFLGGSIPWIKIGDGTVGDNLYIERTAECIIAEGKSKSVYLEPGSLIFANCGVSLGFARILKIGGCIHDGWLALENISPQLNKVFLLKLINLISDHLRQMAPQGTQPNLNTNITRCATLSTRS